MTNPSDHSRLNVFSAITTLSIYRFGVGVPLDYLTKKQIMEKWSFWNTIRSTHVTDLRLGYQAKLAQYFVLTHTDAYALGVVSQITPTDLSPAMRGVVIATLSTPIEVVIRNALNSTHTRQVQRQKLVHILQDGHNVWRKGYLSTLGHRYLSSLFFMGPYMHLYDKFPKHPAAVATVSGLVQVTITAPFFVTAALRQAITNPNDPPLPKSLWGLMKHVAKTRGVMKGLFLPGLGLRSIHSIATSALVMGVMEKYKLIHR